MEICVAPAASLDADAQKYINRLLHKVDQLGVFDEGGFIAGGAARRIAHSIFQPSDWFTIDQLHASNSTSDIDIFFPRPRNQFDDILLEGSKFMKSACNVARDHARQSFGGFAWDLRIPHRIQFVNHANMRYDTIEECFQSFDFVNCMYAIDKKHNGWTLHFNIDALMLDTKKELKINNNKSPFLASRIRKYIPARGLDHLSDESKLLLHEWFNVAIEQKWPHLLKDEESEKMLRRTIPNLERLGFMSAEDISLFLGMWTVQVNEKYSKPVMDDWAKHTLKKYKSCLVQ